MLIRRALLGLHRCEVRWLGCVLVGLFVLSSAHAAPANRLNLVVQLSGTWEDTTYYEVGTWNNGYPDPFHETDADDTLAIVEVLGTRTRPVIEPWPLPGDPVLTTSTVPIGQSIAHTQAIEAKADAIEEQDIEGYARILHLTPTTDQTIDVAITYLMRSEGGIFWVGMKMIDESLSSPVNLLPPQVSWYDLSGAPVIDSQELVTVPVQVLAGHGYTFEVEYDLYPSFVPEPSTCVLVGTGGLALVYRKRT